VRIQPVAIQAADTDRDGRLTGKDAVAFFERSGLPKSELAKVWAFSDSARKGYLDQQAFYKVSIGGAFELN
jgi:EH domain-containing protein 1